MPDTPYLFPVPAAVLRRGLNLRAQLGEEFHDDDAVADVVLDLDAVGDPGHKARDRYGTGLPHAYSYYARRWGWSKTRVARALSGDPGRGVEPWARVRAAEWRSFFGSAAERLGTLGNAPGTKRPPGAPKNADPGTLGNARGTIGNGIEQTSDLQRNTGGVSRAREAGGGHGDDGRFDAFWSGYPVKKGKKTARAAWRRAVGDDGALAARIVADVAERQARDDGWLRGYQPHPTTYLNQERWTDDISERKPAPGRTDRRQRRDDDLDDPAAAHDRNLAAALDAAADGG